MLLLASVLEDRRNGAERLLEEVKVQLLKAGTGERLHKVLAAKEGVNLNLGLGALGEHTLCALNLHAQLLDGTLVLGSILASLLLELLEHVVHDTVVKVLATQMSVTRRSKHLKDAFFDGQQGHVKGTTTKVVHDDVALAVRVVLLVEAVGDGSSSRLRQHTHDVQTGNGTGILGRLLLRIVKVGGARDDRVLHLHTEVLLGRRLHLVKDHGGNLLGRESLHLAGNSRLHVRLGRLVNDLKGPQLLVTLHLRVRKLASDQTLNVKEGVFRVQTALVLGSLTDKTLASLRRKGHDGRRDTVTLIVGNNLNLAMLEHTDAGVRSTKINTNHGTINIGSLLSNNRVGTKGGQQTNQK
mmetsp:Transcript_11153/g.35415  ORF Transcript_11153/g.35415 Transcript_11153/m.35415 type:complete len:354 (+) Transcript_11153:937-1998(+)